MRSDLLAASVAGLTGYGLALLTHFTAPSTTIVAGVLVGVLLSTAATGGLRDRLSSTSKRMLARGARTFVFAAWAAWLIVVMSADVPLAAGVNAAGVGDLASADASFASAQALRPWDADIASIAAQSFAAATDRGLVDAAPLTVGWAERSRAALPGTVATERALAVGQLGVGNVGAAEHTLAVLSELAPRDAGVASQHAATLCMLGDVARCAAEVQRALGLDSSDTVALRVQEFLVR